MLLGTEVGLGLGNTVRWGPSSPPQKKGAQQPTQFSAHVCGGQMAGWVKMPLGMVVGLGSGYIASDGDPAPPPNFWPTSVVAKQLNGSRCHLLGRQTSAQATLC